MLRSIGNRFGSLSFGEEKNYLKRGLIRDMYENQMEPEEDLLIDGTSHEYDAYRNGRCEKAYYMATLYPFGKREPTLICHYGLQGSKIQYVYSSDRPNRYHR